MWPERFIVVGDYEGPFYDPHATDEEDRPYYCEEEGGTDWFQWKDKAGVILHVPPYPPEAPINKQFKGGWTR